MKQRPRRYFTQTEMAVVWDRWERGYSLSDIARDLGRGHSAVQGALARTGGIRPAERRRSRVALSLAEREEISRGIAAGVIAPTRPMKRPGSEHTAPRPVNWHRTLRRRALWPRS